MELYDTAWLSVAAILGLGLYLRRRGRLREEDREVKWVGKAFNIGAVAPRIRALRRDPIAGLSYHLPMTCWHRDVLSSTRRVIIRFDYFRGPEARMLTSTDAPESLLSG